MHFTWYKNWFLLNLIKTTNMIMMSHHTIRLQSTRFIQKVLIRISYIIHYRKYSWEQITRDWILMPVFTFQMGDSLHVNKLTLQITQIQIPWKLQWVMFGLMLENIGEIFRVATIWMYHISDSLKKLFEFKAISWLRMEKFIQVSFHKHCRNYFMNC